MRATEAQLEERRARRRERRVRGLADDLSRTTQGVWMSHRATEREDLARAVCVLSYVQQFILGKGTKESGEFLVNAAKRLAETRADVTSLVAWRVQREGTYDAALDAVDRKVAEGSLSAAGGHAVAPATREQRKDATPVPVTVPHKSNVVDLAAARRRRDAARKG